MAEIYFDMNGIIHNLSRKHLTGAVSTKIQQMLGQLHSAESCSKTPNPIITDAQIKSLAMVPLFEQLYHVMFLIMKRYQGASRLFIALDGIAPLVKWELQKRRRFRYDKTSNMGSETFGREALTPGSSLMFLIERCLFWIAKDFLMQQNSMHTNPHSKKNSFVVIDSACRAGEAEWKNIQHLKISINEQFSALRTSASPFASSSSISLSKLMRGGPRNFYETRRLLCASDADSMLMTLAYPIQSLFTVDVSYSTHKNSLFSPHSIIKSLALINPTGFLELRDGLFLLSLLCVGSDYVSRLQGMPSLTYSWTCFITWTKSFSNVLEWKLIDRSNRSINVEALQNFLSFCQCSSKNMPDPEIFSEYPETASVFDSDIEGKDNRKGDSDKNMSPPLKPCSIDSYLSILVSNLDIIFTGVCRFFFLDRVLSPSIDDIISWKPTHKHAKTPICGSPDPSLLVPGAYAMMLLPKKKYSCLAQPIQSLMRLENEPGLHALVPEREDELISPSLSELVAYSQLLSPLSLSSLEKDFTFSSEKSSIIALSDIDGEKVRTGSSSENKFSQLFSPGIFESGTCSFEIDGRIPFGLNSATVNSKSLSPYADVPSLYQPNDPAVGNWTFLESEIKLINSMMDAYSSKTC